MESGHAFGERFQQDLSKAIVERLAAQLGRPETRPTLRLSKVGPGCPKAYWYSLHHPELAEPLPAWAKIKYTYGHILEALLIALAVEAGHTVTGEQDELSLLDVTGHRDCVIDGAVVDVKSCSSFQFQKIKKGEIEQDDPFGYLVQLGSYVVASASDPLVSVKDRGYLLIIDKTLGHIAVHEHKINEAYIRRCITRAKEISGLTEPPACECGTRPEGNSGNIGLDIKASYSAYKYCCFPNLRTFLYASGPKYLTEVKRMPDVPEINRQSLYVS